MVLAWNQSLDETDFYTVTAVWAHLDSTLVTLTIDGEQIETTPEHPFYIADNAWVAAGELWLGARVKKADGGYGTVKAISVANKPQVMYNLTVSAAHTYHVGEEGWLVHNTCISGRPSGGTGTGNYDRQRGHGVYVLLDEDGTVRYVGRGDAPSRLNTHSNTPGREDYDGLVIGDNNLSYEEARGLEDALINHYGGPQGGQLINKVKGIGEKNPRKVEYRNAGDPLVDEALDIIQNVGGIP